MGPGLQCESQGNSPMEQSFGWCLREFDAVVCVLRFE